ncbi:hypothetical protein [Dokdonia sp.]|uniref:hypothetical protein n=2 Tax=Dokdonia sp. TaxID=2024995 RepID=UPI003263B699
MNSQKKMKHFIYFLLIVFVFSTTFSCVSTRVEANPYQDGAVNIACQKKSSWSYFWGLKQKTVSANPEIEGTECPCRNKAMTWVESKTSLGDFVVSLVTVGIINHRTITYGCARDQGGEGGLED